MQMILSHADKCATNYQHVHMHLSCPQCQTSYEVEDSFSSASVVCHRCGIEFSISLHPEGPDNTKNIQPDELPSGSRQNDPEDAIMEPPGRKKARIWTWLAGILMVIAFGGFWLQKDVWLDNRWVRSTALNLGIPITLHDKDWSIDPESVRAEWVIREDESRVLVIKGKVKNMLSSELPPPIIEVVFFSSIQTDKPISSKRKRITLQPGISAIRRVPYTIPQPDRTPVAPLGTRSFVIVFESLPKDTGDFTLDVRTD